MNKELIPWIMMVCIISANITAATKPNVIVILADDVGIETINSYGGEYFTPRLDELARQGIRFNNAHAMPLCTPTRIRLMTGKYNYRNYRAMMYMHKDEFTVGNLMKNAGYRTLVAGKWQLNDNPMENLRGATPKDSGFDEHFIWQLKRDDRGSRYWGPTLVDNGKRIIIEDMVFGSDPINDYVLDFIERQKQEPFFVYYTLNLAHVPFVKTPDSTNATDKKEKFAGMITYMDKLVGNVMDKLKQHKLVNNTLVIFTSDNGTHQTMTSYLNGEAIQGGKGITTSAGTHVPFIARWPSKIKQVKVSNALVDLMDIYPTLADIAPAGRPNNNSVDGASLMPLMTGESNKARDWIFHHYSPRWTWQPHRYAFNARWKLYDDGRYFDMKTDRKEQHPLNINTLSGETASTHQQLQGVLDTIKDGPLGSTWTHPDMEK